MFPRRFHICETFGIPIYLDISTVILLFFFVGMTNSLSLDLSLALALLVSIVLHELGHALTARSFGYRTRDITLSLLGGCASLTALPRKAWQEFLTAAAGPTVSFLLSALSWSAFVFLSPNDEWAANVLAYSAIMNLMLGLFNLLPGFPMDGGRIFRSVARAFTTRTKATWLAMVVGRISAALLVFGPMMGITHIWVIPLGGSFFMRLLIAWMIWNEGWREYQQTLAEESWGRWDYSARISPPPYGGDSDEAEVRRD